MPAPPFPAKPAAALIIAAASVFALSAAAQQGNDERSNLAPPEAAARAETSGAATAVDRATQALHLAATARVQRSPVLMLAAAELLATVPAADDAALTATFDVTLPENAPAAPPAAQPDTGSPTWRSLLTEAAALARADQTAADFIRQRTPIIERIASRSGTMGAVGGPKRHAHTLPAGAVATYTISFERGRVARVAFVGSGDTNLDLFIYDNNGNLIRRGIDAADAERVSWVPRREAAFTIQVHNTGNTPNRYEIWTN